MKITNLVIGSDGFVGKYLCNFLKEKGQDIIYFDIKHDTKEDARFTDFSTFKFDRTFLLAWEVGGAKYLYRDDTQFVQLNWNLKILTNTIPQISGKPFLFMSSPFAEHCDIVYGAIKRLGEVWSALYPTGRVCRLWNVYGVVEEPSIRSHVISDFISQALQNKQIDMLTSGLEKRQFIHIQDVCTALLIVIESDSQEIHDISSFEWTRIIDIADIIAKETGAKINRGFAPGRNISTSNRKPIGNWKPIIKIEEGLRMLIEDTRNYYEQKKAARQSAKFTL
jgi:nucleoside-diphosphate-sugar epimerase